MNLPGVCQGCRLPVVWNGTRWRNPGNHGKAVHVCPGPRCGAFMPQARERCARLAGHRAHHRTRYAMDNANVARTGRAA